MSRRVIALAFSGGLDTSFCVLYLRETLGADVVAVTVDTGGFDGAELEALERRALALGARAHHTVDARAQVWDRYLSYIVKGNVLRGGVYPLCVGAERACQAEAVVAVARAVGASAVAHGSTGAGNDQARFEIAFRTLAPELEVSAPIRDGGFRRADEAAFLAARGVAVPERVGAYSVNASVWGTTVGGGEIHDPWEPPGEAAFTRTAGAAEWPQGILDVEIAFERGLPVAIERSPARALEAVARLNALAGRHGVGRGLHLGDTVLGIKGRIAFEAPGALALIEAHRALEKLVLTRWQAFWKDHVASFWGQMVHEGQVFDPALRDIQAMVDSSQEHVTGDVRLRLGYGRAWAVGARSPFSLLDQDVARYGEENSLWDGADARGFARIAAVPGILATRAAAGRDATESPGGDATEPPGGEAKGPPVGAAAGPHGESSQILARIPTGANEHPGVDAQAAGEPVARSAGRAQR